MYGHWSFSWVQIMAHNKGVLFSVLGVISLLNIAGLLFMEQTVSWSSWGLLFASIILMSAAMAKLLDSIKAAVLQLGLSLYILAMTLGMLGWLGLALDESSVLGLVILMTVMTSNLVHVLTTLLREMARGLFQFDAIAEALKFNSSPIFLANFTSLMGFAFAAWYEPALTTMAWIVGVGVVVSYLTTLTLLPLILLSWLLEFRVGSNADRYGYAFVVVWMQKRAGLLKLLLVLFAIGFITLLWAAKAILPLLWQLVEMLLVMSVLFMLFWKSMSLAILNTLANLLALTLTLTGFYLLLNLFNEENMIISLLLLMVPMGLIVDDGIHFFSRYVRAKQGMFSDSTSAVRYAMASVGRPIWMTSWIVMIGLVTLLFSPQVQIQQASLITILSLGFATLIILFILPAWLSRNPNQ
ncbi:MAG: hypothetical protein JXK16_00620 [Thiotrichales bacterium]|nr:hypothetical protein [Thiotrichales bacterium]